MLDGGALRPRALPGHRWPRPPSERETRLANPRQSPEARARSKRQLVGALTRPRSAARIPAEPNLRSWFTNGGAQQLQRPGAQGLSLINARDVETLEGLYRFRRMILHTLEDHQATAGRFDSVVQDLEIRPELISPDRVLDQALRALGQHPLDLPNEDDRGRLPNHAALNRQPDKEMRLAATPPTMRRFVSGVSQQWLKNPRCLDPQVPRCRVECHRLHVQGRRLPS
jgi:hypothetical protein